MLFRESVDILTKWLNENDQTHPEQPSGSLSPLPWHVGTRLFADLGPMSPTLQQAAASQDVIGWIEFLHGKVSTEIADIQQAYCSLSSCRMNGRDWMKHFVFHLLHVSHSQWVFRNSVLHDRSLGYLRLQARRDVLLEIKTLFHTNPSRIPAESQILLDMDFDSLFNSSLVRKSYWVRAMKATRHAG